jgi:hypothetical protein
VQAEALVDGRCLHSADTNVNGRVLLWQKDMAIDADASVAPVSAEPMTDLHSSPVTG